MQAAPDQLSAIKVAQSVLMPMMAVREMLMEVAQRGVRVGMVVGFSPIHGEVVSMLVVLVMDMRMGVVQRLVFMHVFVAFGYVQPSAQHH